MGQIFKPFITQTEWRQGNEMLCILFSMIKLSEKIIRNITKSLNIIVYKFILGCRRRNESKLSV